MRMHLATAALVLAPGLITSCRGTGEASGPLHVDSAPAAARVRELWDAHGGAEAWRRHAAVRCRFEIEVPEEDVKLVFDRAAFRLDDERFVWVTRRDGAAPVRWALENPLEHPFEYEGSPGAGFALQALPYLLCLPLATSSGRWEFRTLLAPPDAGPMRAIEVVPLPETSPLGALKLETDPASGLLKSALYEGRHPFVTGARAVTFEDYAEAEGVRFARRRIHFAPAARGSISKRMLVETVSEVAFLDREEADRLCPIP